MVIFLKIVVAYLVFAILTLLGEAAKYIKSNDFNWKIFYSTNIKPLYLTTGVAIIIAAISTKVNYFTNTLDTGEVVTNNISTLFTIASIVTVTLKSLFGKKTSDVVLGIQMQNFIDRHKVPAKKPFCQQHKGDKQA